MRGWCTTSTPRACSSISWSFELNPSRGGSRCDLGGGSPFIALALAVAPRRDRRRLEKLQAPEPWWQVGNQPCCNASRLPRARTVWRSQPGGAPAGPQKCRQGAGYVRHRSTVLLISCHAEQMRLIGQWPFSGRSWASPAGIFWMPWDKAAAPIVRVGRLGGAPMKLGCRSQSHTERRSTFRWTPAAKDEALARSRSRRP